MSCYNSNINFNKTCDNTSCVEKYPLGMAYVPWQEWKNVMNSKEGIGYGTIFCDLVFPFYGLQRGGNR
ncbi:MAG: spore coat associated protein CotJA [Lachnospiraceae bacterium]|nr:spore coat associated protein CotJA [Lachnospiraceae bacterium]